MKRDGLSIDLRTVVILLILVNVPLWALAFFTVGQVETSVEAKTADDFRAIAKKNARTMNYAINHLVAQVATIAVSPNVKDAVRKQNGSYSGPPELIQKRISEIDKLWLTPQAKPYAEPILSNNASQFLRQFAGVQPSVKRITVTDRMGAVAAANVKTVDYDQADEAWWRDTFKDGVTGSVVIEDVTADLITKANSLHIAVPVLEDAQDLVIGTIGAVVDISDLFPLVTGVKIGSTGETLLVKDDGTIIAGAELDSQRSTQLAYIDDIRNAMHSQTKPDFITATAPGGLKKSVAYLDTGLSATYPALKWLTVVEQDYSETHAVVDNLIRKLLLAVLGVLVCITGLALYLSTHRRLHFTDISEDGIEEAKSRMAKGRSA
ncbi:MAG: cache domain-containing protein [Acidobacteria bacterium]|nr:cache domain-containing protein [Acidobacteriota bacterium]MCI0723510.1 cache domain-containing protein [Acidobacteriota bacterium]